MSRAAVCAFCADRALVAGLCGPDQGGACGASFLLPDRGGDRRSRPARSAARRLRGRTTAGPVRVRLVQNDDTRTRPNRRETSRTDRRIDHGPCILASLDAQPSDRALSPRGSLAAPRHLLTTWKMIYASSPVLLDRTAWPCPRDDPLGPT